MDLQLPKGMNEHYGRNTEQMPNLLRNGEIPISTARFMQVRLEHGDAFPDLWNNYVDTSDLVIYPQGRNDDVYVLLTVDNQNRITDNGRIALDLIRCDNLASNYGAVVEKLSDVGREGLLKVPRSEIITQSRFSYQDVSYQDVFSEKMWRILARHPNEVPKSFAEDVALLGNYTRDVEKRTGASKNMALYLGNNLKDEITLKAWYVSRLGDRSYALGWCALDLDDGRFVGIAPEALSELQKTQDGIIAYTPEQVQVALDELGFSGLTKSLIDKLNK
jgi:hypothetical protein